MTKPVFYDTHAHLDFPDFQKDLSDVLRRADEAGIKRIITIGTTLETSRKAVALSEEFPQVFAAIGWHPSYVLEAPDLIQAELRQLAAHPKVVALGETGLDFSRLPSGTSGSPADDEAYKIKQASLFQQQLELAVDLGLNVIVHQRDAFPQTIEQLEPFAGKLRAVFHCFVGTPEEQRTVNSLGCLTSFTGIATFKNAGTVRESIRAAAPNALMLETDCPFLAPVPYRGKRCEPAYVAEIAAHVARERNCTLWDLSAATCATAHEFFEKLTPA